MSRQVQVNCLLTPAVLYHPPDFRIQISPDLFLLVEEQERASVGLLDFPQQVIVSVVL